MARDGALRAPPRAYSKLVWPRWSVVFSGCADVSEKVKRKCNTHVETSAARVVSSHVCLDSNRVYVIAECKPVYSLCYLYSLHAQVASCADQLSCGEASMIAQRALQRLRRGLGWVFG